jgi:hypothetical protein
MRAGVKKLDRELEALRPRVADIQNRKLTWTGLAPAIDPARYTVEVLYQIQNSFPSDSIHITQFEQNRESFAVKGEAPSAAVAVEFVEQLKKNPGLKDYKIESGQPAILPNDHAQFQIFGKL